MVKQSYLHIDTKGCTHRTWGLFTKSLYLFVAEVPPELSLGVAELGLFGKFFEKPYVSNQAKFVQVSNEKFCWSSASCFFCVLLFFLWFRTSRHFFPSLPEIASKTQRKGQKVEHFPVADMEKKAHGFIHPGDLNIHHSHPYIIHTSTLIGIPILCVACWSCMFVAPIGVLMATFCWKPQRNRRDMSSKFQPSWAFETPQRPGICRCHPVSRVSQNWRSIGENKTFQIPNPGVFVNLLPISQALNSWYGHRCQSRRVWQNGFLQSTQIGRLVQSTLSFSSVFVCLEVQHCNTIQVVVSNIVYFHPGPWGNDPIWRAYFSNGWFNHQLAMHFGFASSNQAAMRSVVHLGILCMSLHLSCQSRWRWNLTAGKGLPTAIFDVPGQRRFMKVLKITKAGISADGADGEDVCLFKKQCQAPYPGLYILAIPVR